MTVRSDISRGLVDDLLDVARVTRGKINLQKQPVDITAVIAKAVEIAAPEHVKSFDGRVYVGGHVSRWIEADPPQARACSASRTIKQR